MTEVRWTATAGPDGRAPKGFILFTPVSSRISEKFPIVNGSVTVELEPGQYRVSEALQGSALVVYTVDIPDDPDGIDLVDLHIPDPGTNVTLITRAEFDDLGDTVEGLALTARPFEPVFIQATPAATWTMNHSLGRYPEVTVVDDSGQVVWPDVTYPSTSQVVIVFAQPATGKAVLT